MEAIPRNYDECRFDAFCKSVLRNYVPKRRPAAQTESPG